MPYNGGPPRKTKKSMKMPSLMMSRAERGEIFQRVITPKRHRLNMMHIQPPLLRASGMVVNMRALKPIAKMHLMFDMSRNGRALISVSFRNQVIWYVI
jgi:hypothetical protein